MKRCALILAFVVAGHGYADNTGEDCDGDPIPQIVEDNCDEQREADVDACYCEHDCGSPPIPSCLALRDACIACAEAHYCYCVDCPDCGDPMDPPTCSIPDCEPEPAAWRKWGDVAAALLASHDEHDRQTTQEFVDVLLYPGLDVDDVGYVIEHYIARSWNPPLCVATKLWPCSDDEDPIYFERCTSAPWDCDWDELEVEFCFGIIPCPTKWLYLLDCDAGHATRWQTAGDNPHVIPCTSTEQFYSSCWGAMAGGYSPAAIDPCLMAGTEWGCGECPE